MKIRQATLEDKQEILRLLSENHVSNMEESDKKDGFVTTNFTDQQLERLIEKENGVTIAEENGKVLAFATAASWEFWSEWSIFSYMITILPEFAFADQTLRVQNSYQYGPVCVDQSVRGSGVFEKVFYASLRSMKERYPIMVTFINKINHRSYVAHTEKVPMTQAGTFQFNQNDYYLMACPTDLTEKF